MEPLALYRSRSPGSFSIARRTPVSPIEELALELRRLPGVGTKTAWRLTYHLLKGSKGNLRRLAESLVTVADRIHPCPRCGNYCDAEECSVCRDPARDARVVCVVEEAYDVGAIERAGQYRGVFHVLGGRLSPLDGIGPEHLNVDTLVDRFDGSGLAPQEVILATNTNVEGEATAVYLQSVLRPYAVRVTRLAQGVPIGSDLEYVDGTTIAQALAGRREM